MAFSEQKALAIIDESFNAFEIDQELINSAIVDANVTLNPDVDHEVLGKLMLHVMLNGPVGVNKRTKFRILGDVETSIKASVSETITNMQWQKLCRVAAIKLKEVRGIDFENAPTIVEMGDLWPLYEREKRLQRSL